MDSCRTCAHYAPAEDGVRHGQCRRYHPTKHATYDQSWSAWPPTYPDEWCGEYRKKEQ